jgi:tetratricopeptide (TPR) repeat protein
MTSYNQNKSNELVKEAERYYEEYKYAEAVKSCDDAIQANPGNKYGWLLKGRSLRGMGKYQEAIDCIEESINIDPKYMDGYLGLGHTYYALRDYGKAGGYFDKALELHPRSAVALIGKGLCAQDLGYLHEAISFYEKAKVNTRDSILLSTISNNKGAVFYKMGKTKYNNALDCFAEAFDKNQKNAGAIFGIALIFEKYELKEESTKKYTKAIEVDRNYVALRWISEGVYQVKKHEYDKALDYFDKSLKLNSSFNQLALINLGLISIEELKYKDSIEYFDRALSEDLYYSSVANLCKCYALHKSVNYPNKIMDCFSSGLEFDSQANLLSLSNVVYNSLGGCLVFSEGYDTTIIGKLFNELKKHR